MSRALRESELEKVTIWWRRKVWPAWRRASLGVQMVKCSVEQLSGTGA
jgi:hypothetical protein